MKVRWHNITFLLLVGVTTSLMGLAWAADAVGGSATSEHPAAEMRSPASEGASHEGREDANSTTEGRETTPVATTTSDSQQSESLARCTRGVRHRGSVRDRELFEVCGQVTKSFPREPIGWIGRGIAYYKQADFVNAVQNLSTGLAFAPSDKEALFYRGLAKFRLVQENKFAELLPGIEEDLSKFIQQDATNFQAFETRASVRNRLRKFDPAMQDAQKAKAIAATDADRERVDVAQRLIDTIKRTEKQMFQTR